MGSADRRSAGFGATALIVALAGCGQQPEPALLRADAARVHPDCRVIDSGPGEGDSDTVYMQLELDCATAPRERRLVLAYTRDASGWRRLPEVRDEGPMPGPNDRASARDTRN